MITVFWNFILYSFIGFILETSYAYFSNHRLEDRKCFLYSPLCPVYGFGGAIIGGIFGTDSNLLFIFIGGGIIASSIEYFYSFIYEKSFNLLWWTYADMKYNINGRICAMFSFFWGGLSILLVKIIHPAIGAFIDTIPYQLTLPVFLFVALDAVLSHTYFWAIGSGKLKKLKFLFTNLNLARNIESHSFK